MSLVWNSGILTDLEPKVLGGVLQNPISKLVSTGIPPHVSLGCELQSVKRSMHVMESSILTMMEKNAAELKDAITQKQSQTNVPITTDILEKRLNDFGSRIMNRIETLVSNSAGLPQVEQPSSCVTETIGPPNQWLQAPQQINRAMLYCPPGKIFDLWNLWWGGCESNGIPPLYTCKSRDFLRRCDQANYSKLTKVVTAILAYANQTNSHVIGMTVPERIKFFEDSYFGLCKRLLGSIDVPSKFAGMKYHTFYEYIVKHKS